MTVLVIVLAVLGALCIPKLNWNSIFNISVDLVDNTVLSRCVFIVYFEILLQFKVVIAPSIWNRKEDAESLYFDYWEVVPV